MPTTLKRGQKKINAVKKPAFEMIQIDPTKFIVMKKTPITKDYNII
jgi:hypothetical protein